MPTLPEFEADDSFLMRALYTFLKKRALLLQKRILLVLFFVILLILLIALLGLV